MSRPKGICSECGASAFALWEEAGMPRLDIFICDRCKKQVTNSTQTDIAGWAEVSFMPVTNPGMVQTHSPKILCPACVINATQPPQSVQGKLNETLTD